MPFNYGALENKERVISLTIPYEGMGTIELDYRPGVISKDDILARAKQETDAPEDGAAIKVGYFIELVAKWDVCWPDNTPILLTPEDLAKVKDVFLQNIINAILQDAYVGEAKGQRRQTALEQLLLGWGNGFPGRRVPEVYQKLQMVKYYEGGITYDELRDGELFNAAQDYMIAQSNADKKKQQIEEGRARRK